MTAVLWDLVAMHQRVQDKLPTLLLRPQAPVQWHFQSEHEPGEKSQSDGLVVSGIRVHTSLSAEERQKMVIQKAG